MPNGRCRLHGGLSTGPRTPEGLERSRTARWKHGGYSREAKEERRTMRAMHRALKDRLRALAMAMDKTRRESSRARALDEVSRLYNLPAELWERASELRAVIERRRTSPD